MILSSGVVAVRMARRSSGGECRKACAAQREARLDGAALALDALRQGLQHQTDAGQRAAEHHAEDRQQVARRVPGAGRDHDGHGVERGQAAANSKVALPRP